MAVNFCHQWRSTIIVGMNGQTAGPYLGEDQGMHLPHPFTPASYILTRDNTGSEVLGKYL